MKLFSRGNKYNILENKFQSGTIMTFSGIKYNIEYRIDRIISKSLKKINEVHNDKDLKEKLTYTGLINIGR